MRPITFRRIILLCVALNLVPVMAHGQTSVAELNIGGRVSNLSRFSVLNYQAPNRDSSYNSFDQPTPAHDRESTHLNLFGNIGNNFLHSFKDGNLYLQLSGVAATAVLVPTNVDYTVEHYFNTHPQYTGWSDAVNYTGQFLPFIAGGGLLAYAELSGNDRVLGASFAVIQASLIGVVYNSFLKAITGRPGPDWKHNSNMEDLSETFRFGFLRGGIFWGWPSGHTVASMSVVSALTSYYPHSTWLKIVGYGIVGYTMAAVSAHNRGGMHWFSDAVAGALISYTIGSSVGSYFRSAYLGEDSGSQQKSGLSVSPSIYPPGISISYRF